MIGLFDSGLGGLATLSHLIKAGCDHRFCYIADTRHAPYGGRDALSLIALAEKWSRKLIAMGADRIVVACNTMSLAALPYLRRTLSVPVYGVIPPQVEGALVLGTAFTARKIEGAKALPKLATLIDRDYPKLDRIEEYLQEELKGISADEVVLGCTHYAWVKDLISAILHAKTVIDPSLLLAKSLPLATKGKGVSVDIVATGEDDPKRYADLLRQAVGEG